MGDQWLRGVFDSVDKDKSGQISERELQKALSNGTWKPFEMKTVRMMIALFDRQRKYALNFEEFRLLWKFVDDWLKCFSGFDRDNSGTISRQELIQALTQFGYRFSDKFYNFVFTRFGDRSNNTIIFDNFIYLCLSLQHFTTAFRSRDVQQTGVINISYDDFLGLVLENLCI
ncbi:programmed cell death protein 6-like protein [Dinothrombium tinctorium]|uniref:Programmed cell death protein 6-like protein n=1 Tax=Dinothrombium tinctorium TaxID=1965070 RepID=A0A3S4R802_9ACAR|nr:programmed cell death protein 6-like protein [Dinothrombium tinctorium]RWS10642.1 programmed cell death protein 6-like protein [Dinothrombium tinctorium]RWS10645.1 programmed cell death protein 6-like protein [Dinothrombium tinctorium]RWS10648.1 programmed cell death protein 6-like protein [Dinothrombium tinctorium]RWS10650.1 programmed cell death protein 6-like protein [Dinothrombium tinctorium]